MYIGSGPRDDLPFIIHVFILLKLLSFGGEADGLQLYFVLSFEALFLLVDGLDLYIFIFWLATEIVWVFDDFSASRFFILFFKCLISFFSKATSSSLRRPSDSTSSNLKGIICSMFFLPAIVLRMMLMMPLVYTRKFSSSSDSQNMFFMSLVIFWFRQGWIGRWCCPWRLCKYGPCGRSGGSWWRLPEGDVGVVVLGGW